MTRREARRQWSRYLFNEWGRRVIELHRGDPDVAFPKMPEPEVAWPFPVPRERYEKGGA